ncbi:MAG: SIS domain-containing protein [Janthinobacterium lividum]
MKFKISQGYFVLFFWCLNFVAPTSATAPFEESLDPKEKYRRFQAEFSFENTTTEKICPITKNLSENFKRDPLEGLSQLNQVDQTIIKGIRQYQSDFLDLVYCQLRESQDQGGKIIFLGAGSSGRIAVDLASKWRAAHQASDSNAETVKGIIAGGIGAFVRAKEGFEDSESSGKETIQQHGLREKDVVFLVSASGSAKFNVGAGIAARDAGAKVYYFYNSKSIPARTQDLFDKFGVIPLMIDTGPQAISGSTRLQAASLAEFILGGALNALYLNLHDINSPPPAEVFDKMIENLEKGNQQIEAHFKDILAIVEQQIAIFLSPKANFFRAKDETSEGYTTFISPRSAIREIMIDTTETPPTFTTNPPRFIHEEGRKKAEFRAYVSGAKDNQAAWENLMGRPIARHELKEIETVLVDMNGQGFGCYADRPKRKGNMLIGVINDSCKNQEIIDIFQILKDTKAQGALTSLIAILEKPLSLSGISAIVDHPLIITYNPDRSVDPLGIVRTIILKQTLNMISNLTMMGLGKIEGNIMIDVAASNNKLIDRTIRIIQNLYQKDHFTKPLLEAEMLFHMIEKFKSEKQRLERESGGRISFFPIVRIIKCMIEHDCGLLEANDILREIYLKSTTKN